MWIRRTWLFESCLALWVVGTGLIGGLLATLILLVVGNPSSAMTALGVTLIGVSAVVTTCWIDYRRNWEDDEDPEQPTSS